MRPKGYLNIYETAACLGISDASVRRRIRSGRLPAIRSGEGGGRIEVWIPSSALANAPGGTHEAHGAPGGHCDASGPSVDTIGADLAVLAGSQQTQIQALKIELARVRRVADDRGEAIMSFKNRLDIAEMACSSAEMTRDLGTTLRREELLIAALCGFVCGSLVFIMIGNM